MNASIKRTAVVTLALFGLVGCGSGDEGKTTEDSGGSDSYSRVIANVGDIEITQAYFDTRYSQLSPSGRSRFSGENWEARFLDEIVEETLLYLKAMDDEFDQDPDVQARLDTVRRQILVNAYSAWISQVAEPSDEEVQSQYDLNSDQYRTVGRVMAYIVRSPDKEAIDAAWIELEKGEQFGVVARKYSDEEESRKQDGFVSWVNEGGYVPGLGFNDTFTGLVFSLEKLEYTEPIELNGNWYIIRAGTKVPGDQQELTDVRERVVEDVRPRIVKRYYDDHVEELEATYPVERFGEFRQTTTLTDEQLYKLASEAKNPFAKVDFYQTLATDYPQSDHADDALFMMGFLYGEEMQDWVAAAIAYRTLITEYPESEYIEDSEYMLRNLRKRHEPLSPGTDLDDAEAVRSRVESVRDQ